MLRQTVLQKATLLKKEAKDLWVMCFMCHPKTQKVSFVTADCTAESHFTKESSERVVVDVFYVSSQNTKKKRGKEGGPT